MPQFDDLEQQQVASNLGMWMFLATEVMFFGGLFAAYVVYRSLSPHEFALASQHLNLMAGVRQHRRPADQQPDDGPGGPFRSTASPPRADPLPGAHDGPGLCFLGIKAVEYYQEYRESLIPGLNFRLPEHAHRLRSVGPRCQRFEMFFVLYFFMTGLHAFHLIIGIVLVGVMAYLWSGDDGFPAAASPRSK